MIKEDNKDKEIQNLKQEILALKRAHNVLEGKVNHLMKQNRTLNSSLQRLQTSVDILRRK